MDEFVDVRIPILVAVSIHLSPVGVRWTKREQRIQSVLNLKQVLQVIPIRVRIRGICEASIHFLAIGQPIAVSIRHPRVGPVFVFLAIRQPVRPPDSVAVVRVVVRQITELPDLPRVRHPVAIQIHKLIASHVHTPHSIGEDRDSRLAINVLVHSVGRAGIDAGGIGLQSETVSNKVGVVAGVARSSPSVLHATFCHGKGGAAKPYLR